ncbi:hypothetical protein D3C78_1840360 [compost metagenome]
MLVGCMPQPMPRQAASTKAAGEGTQWRGVSTLRWQMRRTQRACSRSLRSNTRFGAAASVRAPTPLAKYRSTKPGLAAAT